MVKYYLDKRTPGREAPIILSLQYRGKRFKVYTGKAIEQEKWDPGNCRANPRKYKADPVEFNNWLDFVSNEVQALLNKNKSISSADIKQIIDKANGKETNDTFFGFAESYINSQIKKGELRESTAKACRVSLGHLRAFKPDLSFNDVNLEFRDKFIIYLRGLKLRTNSIGGHIKKLKWFMNAALDRDLHTNYAFKKQSFSTPKEESDQVYLTKKELKLFSTKDLSDKLRRVADAFLMNCYLGMRFSDLSQIVPANFIKTGKNYQLHMIQAKGNQKMIIPIPKEALPILTKYKFTCPVLRNEKLMSVQKFNEYLKEAAEACGLNQPRQIQVDGETMSVPLSALIKSHTARRTFATNLYLDGVPTQQIMAVTGHKKEETFLLYIRADAMTKAKGLETYYRKIEKTQRKSKR